MKAYKQVTLLGDVIDQNKPASTVKDSNKKKEESRIFKEEWKIGRPWLIGKKEGGEPVLPFCLCCGATLSQKLDALKKHEKSQSHEGCLDNWVAQPQIKTYTCKAIRLVHKVSNM